MVCHYSESNVDHSDEGISRVLLLIKDHRTEWAWFNQCDVTLAENLIAAEAVLICVSVVHVSAGARYPLPSCQPFDDRLFRLLELKEPIDIVRGLGRG